MPTLFPVPAPAAPAPAQPARRRRPAPPADPSTGAADARGARAAPGAAPGADPGTGDADRDPGRAIDTAGSGPAGDPPRPDDPRRQLAFFGAEATDPSVADLAGLLAGPAEVSVMGGTARLAVVVDAAWRVHVLVAELAARGLRASWEETGDGRHAVRTSYTRLLKPLAAAWLNGPAKRPPDGLHLNGRRLRLWLAAAGSVEPPDVVLRLGAVDDAHVAAVGAALAAAGLPNAVLDPDVPAYRVTGRRDLTRLTELIGDAPPRTPPGAWPSRP
ncbi:hypothetical protein HCJ94_04240 [Micromonospora sp. HSS6-12]|uniref:Uncharacterized protein n=1 Tax=Micromonospora thermarum TaxID=2720024 RepID=A0ABX0Z0C2_9ACTN|nr:hypothetical protein [Micromonospora thermarum]